MKQCSRCVMPETSETLAFDGGGVCTVCQQVEFKQTGIDWDAKKLEFEKLVEEVRGKHDYDCIVPFSGGKDSTYTLWYLVKELGLKPLVVRFDHGFMRSTLIENNIRSFRKLGCDVMTFTPNWQVVRKLMFEALRRRADFCWHCHTGIFAYPMRIAVEKQVPLVIWGEPSAEYASFYGYDEDEEVDERRFNTLVNLGINAEDMIGMLDNTIVIYGSSNSQTHVNTDYPMMLVGGGNLGLKHGTFHQLGATTPPLSNMYLSLLNALDVPATQFSDSTSTFSQIMV